MLTRCGAERNSKKASMRGAGSGAAPAPGAGFADPCSYYLLSTLLCAKRRTQPSAFTPTCTLFEANRCELTSALSQLSFMASLKVTVLLYFLSKLVEKFLSKLGKQNLYSLRKLKLQKKCTKINLQVQKIESCSRQNRTLNFKQKSQLKLRK